MRIFVDEGGAKKPLAKLSYPQAKQAAAIMDCVGRLIPQEGVDYNIDIIFKSTYDQNVSMSISPMTDKGEWWRQYVLKMINKYPPTVGNPEQSLPEDQRENEQEAKEDDHEKIMP